MRKLIIPIFGLFLLAFCSCNGNSNTILETAAITEIEGIPISEFETYTTEEGRPFYSKDNMGVYDESGNLVVDGFNCQITGLVEYGSNLAVVTMYESQTNGTSVYNCGPCGITIIDKNTNQNTKSLFGFDAVEISQAGNVFFETQIANTPTELTFEDIINCQIESENALEYIYSQKHPNSVPALAQESIDDYRWIEGKWRYSDGGWTTELRICDFGDGLWMMTYWMDGHKEDEGTIDVYDGAIHFEGKKLSGMYFPIDAQQQQIYADGNRTRAFYYAGSLM